MRPATRHVLASVATLGIWFYVWAYRLGRRADAQDARSIPLLRWSLVLGPIGIVLLTLVLVLSVVIVLDATGAIGQPWADDNALPAYFWVMMAASLLVNLFWIPAAVLVSIGLWRAWNALQIKEPALLLIMLLAGALAFPPLMLVAQWMTEDRLNR